MLSMLLYGISILFSPGPVTLIALNKGIRRTFKESFGFYLSIGVATYLLIVVYSFIGSQWIKPAYMTVLTFAGCAYLFYLSYKMFHHESDMEESTNEHHIGFKEGFLIQLLNPKATLAALPIATIQYPMNSITGSEVLLVSIIFLVLGCLSPCLYAFVGQYFTKWMTSKKALGRVNKAMALLLCMVSVIMLYEGVFVGMK